MSSFGSSGTVQSKQEGHKGIVVLANYINLFILIQNLLWNWCLRDQERNAGHITTNMQRVGSFPCLYTRKYFLIVKNYASFFCSLKPVSIREI